MADKSTPPAREKSDPTVRNLKGGAPEYPEGTHPIKAASETTHSATNIEYQDMPEKDKPDPTTVAQVQVPNPDFPNQGPTTEDEGRK